MRIFNEQKTIELTKEQCDLNIGYLKEQKENNEIIYIYTLYTQKQLLDKEKQKLEYWFANDYREMFEKCTRRITLGKTLRDGSNPNIKLQELYAKAETNANRINEISILLQTL